MYSIAAGCAKSTLDLRLVHCICCVHVRIQSCLEKNLSEAVDVWKPDLFLSGRLFLPSNSPCSPLCPSLTPLLAMASFTHGYGI